jgi:phosphoglycerate dehydrogenase-like enzyme
VTFTKTPKLHVIAKIPLTPIQRSRLVTLGATYFATSDPVTRNDQAEIEARISTAELILISIATPVTASIIARNPQLRFIQTWSTGFDHVDLEAAQAAEIMVCNVRDYSIEAVAEKTIGLMLFAANRLLEANRSVISGKWEFKDFIGRELKGRTLLLVGCGQIGRRVSELASAFDMNVLIARSNTSSAQLDELLPHADFISLHCPYTSNTRHLISDPQFFRMKSGVILINNGRGGVIDEAALHRALDSGQVSYATMDVFESEPPSPDHPLLHHARVFVTPHCTWNTEESIKRLTETAIQNIEAFLRGTPTSQVTCIRKAPAQEL